MSVNFHRQAAAIDVPQPSAYGGDIDARLNAARGKEMTQIVVRDTLNPDFFARIREGFFTLVDQANRIIRTRIPFTMNFYQLFLHGGYDRHMANARRTGGLASLGIVHADFTLGLIHVGPSHLPGFGDSAATE
jgi:hypothetical protein